MGCQGAAMQPAGGGHGLAGGSWLHAGARLCLSRLFTSSLSNYLFNSEGGLIK